MIDQTIHDGDTVVINALVHVDDLAEYEELTRDYSMGERYQVITVLGDELCFVQKRDDEVSEWFSSRLFVRVV